MTFPNQPPLSTCRTTSRMAMPTESPSNVRRLYLRANVDRLLLLAAALSCSALTVACEPSTLSCAETATCPPTPRPDGGADVSTEAGENDVAPPGMDGTTDTPGPSVDVTDERSVDAPAHDDADTGWPHEDAPADTPIITDAAGEADACDPGTAKSPVESACLISEKYGVFVSPQGSDGTGFGTRGAPFKTIGRALQGARSDVMRVYACDDGTGYPDALAINTPLDGMSLYGGFECAGWTYAVTRRARVRPATGVALSIKALTVGFTIEDVEFDATDAAMGASSIGAIVDTSTNIVLRGVKVVAGKGGGGAVGAEGAKGADGPDTGTAQQGSPAICPPATSPQNGGAWSSVSLCGSLGGNGGAAIQFTDGNPGTPGNPRTGVHPPNVDNGGDKGSVGQDGIAGSPGNAGTLGATNLAAGTFSATGFAVAAPGGDGTAGNVGQGGGGGGASNAPALSACIGASGGAGGMGGCGGLPGRGGASAGASVALLSWMSTLTLERCELISVNGGVGGNGGNGGLGGEGKPGGAGGAAYAGDAGPDPDAGMGLGKGGNGGSGSKGGNGGSGAGGNGGPSYALVYKGTAPHKLNGTSLVHGTGGEKGIGGSLDIAKAPDGIVGTAAEEFAVP